MEDHCHSHFYDVFLCWRLKYSCSEWPLEGGCQREGGGSKYGTNGNNGNSTFKQSLFEFVHKK